MTDNANYSYISTVKTPDNQTHYIKDAEARAAITALETQGVKYRGFTATALEDGSTTQTIQIYDSGSSGSTSSYTAAAGDFVIYNKTVDNTTIGIEFFFDGTSWGAYGSAGALKALAYKDSASGNYTPAGNVTVSTLGTTNRSITASFSGSALTATASYTPEGSITVGTLGETNKDIAATFTGTSTTSTGTYKPEGTISKPSITVTPTTSTFVCSVTMTVSNETLTLGSATGSAMTGASAALASTPSFTGTSKSVSVTGTPAGSVTGTVNIGHSHTGNSFTGTATELSAVGTPAGSVTGTVNIGHSHTGSFSGTAATITVA